MIHPLCEHGADDGRVARGLGVLSRAMKRAFVSIKSARDILMHVAAAAILDGTNAAAAARIKASFAWL